MQKLTPQENKDWLASVALWAESNGCFPYLHKVQFQIHHVLGRTKKHNKCSIGLQYVLPIQVNLHDVMSAHYLNVTHFPAKFEDEFGTCKSMFKYMVDNMRENNYYVPFTEELDEVIMTTKVWGNNDLEFGG